MLVNTFALFVFRKDYECNRLTSGILQLSNNTHLVIDETSLTTGTLTVTGKENYKALSDLLMFQKLTYDFKYYTMEYETDIPILIFSDVKSFVPVSIYVQHKIYYVFCTKINKIFIYSVPCKLF